MRKLKLMKLLQIGIVSLMIGICMKGWADEAHSSFKGAKKARIIIKEDYGEAKKVSLVSNIIKLTSGLLKHAGVEVVTEPTETDFTINVDVKGKALKAYYPALNKHCYSGAEVKVVVLFKTKDGYKIKEKGEGKEKPLYTISEGTYSSPDDAPFWSALKRPAIESIVKLLHKSFGITPLISLLKYEDPSVRYVVSLELGEIKDLRAVEALISLLKDEYRYVRKAAAKALGKINPMWTETGEAKKAVSEFISSLKDKNSDVRYTAAEALGETKDNRAVEVLISLLKDEYFNVRKAAANALGEIKDRRAVEPLISALEDECRYVRRTAAEALEKITGQIFDDDYNAWQRWWQKNKAKYSK